jgi:hypothetical protein
MVIMLKRYLLIVEQGISAGGSCPIDEKKTYFIGSDEACDIILSDPGIELQHAALTITDAGVSWRSVQGSLSHNNQTLKKGNFANWPLNAEIIIASTKIRIEPKSKNFTKKTITSASKKAAESFVNNDTNQNKSFFPKIKKISLAVVMPLFVVGIFIFLNQKLELLDFDSQSKSIVSKTLEEKITEILDGTAGSSELSFTTSEGKAVISGYVNTREDFTKLKDRVRLDQIPVSLQISTGEDLSVSVQDVMRMHGVIIATTYEGDGVVKVNGLKESGKKFETAVRASLENVNGLKRITLGETDFQTAQITEKKSEEPVDNNQQVLASTSGGPKRVTALVGGDSPFVMTEDGTRYFEGAMLPLGHKLVQIREKEIVVERDGQSQVVAF